MRSSVTALRMAAKGKARQATQGIECEHAWLYINNILIFCHQPSQAAGTSLYTSTHTSGRIFLCYFRLLQFSRCSDAVCARHASGIGSRTEPAVFTSAGAHTGTSPNTEHKPSTHFPLQRSAR